MSLTSGSGSGSSTYNCTSATVVTAAVIGSSYSEQLSCSLAAQLSASVYTLWLCLDGYGCSFAGSNYTVPFTLTQALPTSGSLAGGQLVNLTGSGVCGGGRGGHLPALTWSFVAHLTLPLLPTLNGRCLTLLSLLRLPSHPYCHHLTAAALAPCPTHHCLQASPQTRARWPFVLAAAPAWSRALQPAW